MLIKHPFNRIEAREVVFAVSRNENVVAAHFLEPGDQVTSEKPCPARDHNSLVGQIES